MQASFNNIVQHLFHQPSLHSVTVDELEDMAVQHPYFAAAHFLLLKKMQDAAHPNFKDQLQKTTLYFNNPLWLQYLLQPGTVDNFKVSEKPPFIIDENETLSTTENKTSFAYQPQEEKVLSEKEPAPVTEETEHKIQETNIAQEPVSSGIMNIITEIFDEKEPIATPAIGNNIVIPEPPVENKSIAADVVDDEHEQANMPSAIAEKPQANYASIIEQIRQANRDENAAATTTPVGEQDSQKSKEETTGSIAEQPSEVIAAIDSSSIESTVAISAPVLFTYNIPFAEEAPQKEQTPALAVEATAAESIVTAILSPVLFIYNIPFVEEKQVEEIPAKKIEMVSAEDVAAALASPVLFTYNIPFAEEIKPEENLPLAEEHTSNQEPVAEAPTATNNVSADESLSPLSKQLASFKTIIETPASKDDVLFEPFHTVDYFASQGIKLSQQEVFPKDKLGKQLKSFTEWLKGMKRLPQVSIDKILSENDETQVVADAIHSIENKEVITEAMAEVFEKQGMNDRAAVVYQKLSLLNPEKSAYFAAKIEALKQN